MFFAWDVTSDAISWYSAYITSVIPLALVLHSFTVLLFCWLSSRMAPCPILIHANKNHFFNRLFYLQNITKQVVMFCEYFLWLTGILLYNYTVYIEKGEVLCLLPLKGKIFDLIIVFYSEFCEKFLKPNRIMMALKK